MNLFKSLVEALVNHLSDLTSETITGIIIYYTGILRKNAVLPINPSLQR